MAKFYVQCGTTELVLSSDCAESAALAMIDRLLTPHLWVYDDADLSELDCRTHLMLEALLHLPTELQVSERGLGRADATRISVPETIELWHQLMVGMRRLFSLAGLNRSVSVLACSDAIGQSAAKSHPAPRRPR